MTSPIYWHPKLYEYALRLLYGRYYHERYQMVANEINSEISVIDLCAGDCALYRHYLKYQINNYLALDHQPKFVHWANQQNISARLFDLNTDEIPKADCIVMLGSLYQFIPNQNAIIEKILASANQKVILTEPIRNWAQSSNPLIQFLANHLTHIKQSEYTQRFDYDKFYELTKTSGFQKHQIIAGERELMAVYKK